MAMIKVTSDQLASLAASLKGGNEQVQQQLASMRSQVAPVAADWQGAAAGNFQQLWQEWDQGAKQIQEALDGIAMLLQKAAQTYDAAESSISRSMTS
jgi:WXG100 family type VII secretion target